MNKKLRQIYEEDISDRNNKIPDEQINENDRKRIDLVQKILANDKNLSAQDYHHAALIFQHGETLIHYKKAYELAKTAVKQGDDTSRWLVAATLDRSLLMEGKAQKYGTQFKMNENGKWELALPIDTSITDEERVLWNVPPLKDALKVFNQKYSINS